MTHINLFDYEDMFAFVPLGRSPAGDYASWGHTRTLDAPAAVKASGAKRGRLDWTVQWKEGGRLSDAVFSS
jgi:hypothetical protein